MNINVRDIEKLNKKIKSAATILNYVDKNRELTSKEEKAKNFLLELIKTAKYFSKEEERAIINPISLLIKNNNKYMLNEIINLHKDNQINLLNSITTTEYMLSGTPIEIAIKNLKLSVIKLFIENNIFDNKKAYIDTLIEAKNLQVIKSKNEYWQYDIVREYVLDEIIKGCNEIATILLFNSINNKDEFIKKCQDNGLLLSKENINKQNEEEIIM